MNEREIANTILSIVDQPGYQRLGRRVAVVHLAVRGIFDPDRLQATFTQAARGTVAEGADLTVKKLPIRHRCNNCGLIFDSGPTDTSCPNCIHLHTETIGDEEFHVIDVELSEAA